MTSIAAFISNLAGGSSKNPLAAPANAAGTGGLFSTLLAATGATTAAEGEIATIPNPLDPAAASGGAPAVLEAKTGDTALLQALTGGLGLARDGAEVNATTILGAVSTDTTAAGTTAAVSLLPGAPQTIQGQNSKTAPATAVQGGQTQQAALEQSAAPAPGQNSARTAANVQVQPETGPQDQNGRAGADARTAGQENTANKASQTTAGNAAQNAETRLAQPATRGEAQPTGLAQANDRTNARGAPASGGGSAEYSLTARESKSRSDFAPGGPRIIQQQVKPGSGMTLIRFQQFTGGESASASGTPTLTVSVQAHAASPSPAPANVPHVPVSALAVHIAQQASNGARRFDIRLDPPELGRIEVRLEVSRDGRVMTHLVVERSETLDLLQRDARQLERALQDAGLNTSKEDMKFSLKDQSLAQGGDGQEDAQDESASLTGDSDDDLALNPGDTMPPPTRYLASTGLDIRI